MTEVATSFTSLIGIATSALGLLTEFPLNIMVAGAIGGVAIGLVRKMKKTAR